MNVFGKGSHAWKVMTFALVVVPWFLKDQLATSLEERSRNARKVLIEENHQEQREEQEIEQRQVVDRLARIELRQIQTTGELSEAQIARAVADDLSRSFAAEGKALHGSMLKFNELLPKIPMEAATRRALEAKAHQVEAVTQELEKSRPETPQQDNQALLERWAQAEVALGEAYEQLSLEAERDRDSSANQAFWSRIAAWVFTALAAFMMGDWTKSIQEVQRGVKDVSSHPAPGANA
ncbi:MAG: hypothetical protein HXX12_16590 [Geothrix sp.]|uniref:hypothetical protein n=1 Tax=Geothrix sp. TaxID=1962974 RepID=UPI0017E4CD31|nr:hypothetical protein [Geothrix sp.]NWJ42582.1 hypothetical protein [Geothrix sp.]WIL19458.1 MAG: hypothetical protein QOZ81_001975 [Geothrix sp.]